jgi:hypothetical protein
MAHDIRAIRGASGVRMKAVVLMFVAAGLAGGIGGCAAITPNYIAPELVHQSHAVQHFGSDRTNYGSEALALEAHWDLPKHLFLDVSEGIALDKRMNYPGYVNSGGTTMYGYGEVLGPREQFTAKIGYRFQLK